MISAILRDSFDLYRRFSGRLIGTAVLVFVVMDLIAAITDSISRRGGGFAAAFWGLVSMLVWIVGTFWLQGALVEAVQDVRDGRADSTIGQLFQKTRPRLPVLIAAGLLAGLGITIGLFLLIIPGLYLLTRWVLLVPVIMIERRNAASAFGRSNQLVRGYGWDVFGLVVITLLASVILQGVLTSIFVWLPRFLSIWIGGLIAHSLVIPYVLIAWTLLYHRLVERRPEAPTTTVGQPPQPSPPPTIPPLQPPTPTTP